MYLQRLDELPRLEKISYKYKAVSLFAGGGGLDLGLSFAGFATSFATDLEESLCETIRFNFPEAITEAIDIRDLTGKHIFRVTGSKEFDLLAGGPPCQSFSILGQRNSFKDPRGALVYEYVRLINELKPKAFVFENVPGLLTLNRGKDWSELLQYFKEETGYSIHSHLLNAANYGIPQIRQRVIVVGFRSHKSQFKFPPPKFANPDRKVSLLDNHLPAWLPSKLALEDLDNLPNHRIRPHGERVRNRYSLVPPGTRDKVDHTDRINPEKPSGTVLVGSKAGGGRPFIHPYEPRHLTVREAARLQSFPDWYVFQATDTWQYRSVGNAVPPIMAMEIGMELDRALGRA